MNKPNLKIVLATIFVLGLTVGGIFGYRVAMSAYVGDVSDVYVNPPFSEASYVVGQYNSTHYYAKNGTTGNYDYLSTNASYVIQLAFNGLSSGRDWLEKVVVKGDFSITNTITIPSYTYLDLSQATLTLANSANCDMFRNIDFESGPAKRVHVYGGRLFGNHDNNNAGSAFSGEFYRMEMENIYITSFYDYGIHLTSYSSGTPDETNRSRISFYMVQVWNCRLGGIYLSNEGGHAVSDSDLTTCTSQNNGNFSLYITYGSNNKIVNCHWTGGGYGGHSWFAPSVGVYLYGGTRAKIIGCEFESSDKEALYLKGCDEFEIIGNTFWRANKRFNNTYSTIYMNTSAGTCYSGSISNNIFTSDYENKSKYSIEKGGSYDVVNVTITGNSFADFYTAAINGIDLAQNDISGNFGFYALEEKYEDYHYLVGQNAVGAFMKNGITQNIEWESANETAIINAAFGNLTAGRDYKEKVIIVGNYDNMGQLSIPSHTLVEIVGKIKAKPMEMINGHLIYSSGTHDIELCGGFVDANKEVQTESMSAIHFYQVQNFSIHDMTVKGGFRTTPFEDSEHGEGIEIWDCDWGKVSDCYSYRPTYDCIKVRGGSTNILITDNICVNSENKGGIQISTDGTRYINVIGNIIYQSYHVLDNAIRIHSADNVLVEGNQIYCYDSSAIQLIDGAFYNAIQGNNIVTYDGTGISTFGGTPSASRPTNNFIKDNTIIMQASGVGVYILNGYDNELIGNVIRGVGGGTGIMLGSSYVNGTKVLKNVIRNVADPIHDDSTFVTIKGNEGFTTENSGITTNCINGTWIAHNVAKTPQIITLTISGSNYINSTCFLLSPTIIASNSTHFQIGFYINNAGTITAVTTTNQRDIMWTAEYKP